MTQKDNYFTKMVKFIKEYEKSLVNTKKDKYAELISYLKPLIKSNLFKPLTKELDITYDVSISYDNYIYFEIIKN